MESQSDNATLVERLFKAGAHFGFSKSRRHPSFVRHIFGSKNSNDIIDLEKTAVALSAAKTFVEKMGRDGKNILIAGTKPEVRSFVEEQAKKAGIAYVTERWVGGLLTNFHQMRKRVERLEKLEDEKAKGALDVYTKKERLGIDEEIRALEHMFNGIRTLKQLPDLVFIVDSRHEETALLEARKLGIPVVALSGSDCDVSKIAYPIPANDSVLQSITFFVEEILSAFKRGREEFQLKGKTEVQAAPKETK
ncbi:MAG: 30S ribosomal protein S2 [Parcubacteria group bacterium]|nr:30S ribosomal protein S2 [Parcubacteria group bacterium]